MKQKTIIGIIMLACTFAGCSEQAETSNPKIIHKKTGSEESNKAKTGDKDVIQAFKNTVKFIGWYNKNVENLDQDKLVMYSDSCDYYIMNEEHADFYINQFKQTGLVSEKFLENFRKEFKSFRAYFEEEKLDKDTDGPIGYPYDIIYNGQDPDYYIDLNEIQLKEFTIKENEIELLVDALGFVILVKDRNAKWLIDKIY